MTTDPTTAIAPAAAWAPPTGIAELYGRPPLAAGEDPDAYHGWLRRVALTVRPQDPFEWVLIKDYVDISWEIVRMRRCKAAMLDRARVSNIQAFVSNTGGYSLETQFKENRTNPGPVLAQVGMTEQTFAAAAMCYILDDIEQADRIIAAAEERRDAALKHVDQHRATLGYRLRKARAEIVDAEFEDVTSVEAGAPADGREMAAVSTT